MKDFEGKTAVVTGGASGIGLGLVRALLDRGMKVVMLDLLQAHLDEAAASLRGENRLHQIRLDVADRAAMAEAAAETARVFGPVHILCNNVGVSQRTPIDEASYDDWDYVLGVNIGGTINGLVSFLPGMKAHGQGGHVVNTSSMAGMIPVPAFAGLYATSKFAIRGMTDALRLALGQYRIGASVLCPGMTRTRATTAGTLYRQTHLSGIQADDPREPIEHGMDPDALGRRVVAGIEANEPYIFPHGEFRDEVAAHFAEMLAAFPLDYEADDRRREGEARRARMTEEARAIADALD